VNGLGTSPVTLRFTGQTISFTANGANVTLSVPDSVITFSPSATMATTTFDPSGNAWVTTLPFHFSGNGFLGGLAFPVTSALPGGIQRVNWQGQLTSDTAGVTVNWQWAAAVYTQFNVNYAALQVKPVDDNQLSQYQNSDHAGTPEAFKAYVIGGATGGGGSNWTGSYSATASVAPPVVTAPPPSSLSGFVFNELTGAGFAGVVVTLTGTNDLGQAVSLTTATGSDGSYHFGGLRPGTYAIAETPPANYFDDVAANTVGTLGGTSSTNLFSGIVLPAGANGLNYDFELLMGS
jgi:hypothetical protein